MHAQAAEEEQIPLRRLAAPIDAGGELVEARGSGRVELGQSGDWGDGGQFVEEGVHLVERRRRDAEERQQQQLEDPRHGPKMRADCARAIAAKKTPRSRSPNYAAGVRAALFTLAFFGC